MRYQQSKEQSSEILRLVLPLMARQEAAFHPMSYALWYEHVTGLNPDLSRILTRHLETNQPLTEQEIQRLYMQHILARDVESFERVQQQFRALLDDTARHSARANIEATRCGDTLHDGQMRLADLAAPANGEPVRRIVGDLIDNTQRICVVTADLSAKLASSKREIDTLTERLERAQTEALLDPLTGLRNRRGFERALENRYRERGLVGSALLLADIDHFKEVNDRHGHLQGDKVIRAVAEILQAHIRGNDIVARLGGEEFVALLPDTSLAGASVLAERIRRSIAEKRILTASEHVAGHQVTVSVCIAIAHESETLARLIERADAAMYSAKKSGRNRVGLAAQSVTVAATLSG